MRRAMAAMLADHRPELPQQRDLCRIQARRGRKARQQQRRQRLAHAPSGE
jgi:hypothetical protein